MFVLVQGFQGFGAQGFGIGILGFRVLGFLFPVPLTYMSDSQNFQTVGHVFGGHDFCADLGNAVKR